MAGLLEPDLGELATALVNSGLSAPTLRSFVVTGDKKGTYLKDYEVDIHRSPEVSPAKYFALVSGLDSRIELHLFMDNRFSGVVLTPSHIRNHARIVFMKHETTGKVLVKGIAKADLPNACDFISRRGFGKLLRRDACYDKVRMRTIVGDEATGCWFVGMKYFSSLLQAWLLGAIVIFICVGWFLAFRNP